MKKFKKTLSVLIAALMLVSALPMMVVSAQSAVLKETVTVDEYEEFVLPLTVEQSGYYRFYSTGEYDAYCVLSCYDPSYEDYGELVYFEDCSEEELNFDMRWYLEAGEQYELEIGAYCDAEATFDVIVEPADYYVTDIKLTKMPDIDFVIEGSEYDSFWVDGIELEATFSDGLKTEYVYDPYAYPDNILGSVIAFDGYGLEEGYFEIYCDEAYAKVEIDVVENPVDHIEYTGTPIVVEENVDGELYEGVFYYYYYFGEEDTFKIYYKDGTSEEMFIDDVFYNAQPGVYPLYSYDNQFDTPWTAGGNNALYLEYLGHEAEVPVVIIPGPEETFMVGDSNSDGKINVKDATQIQKAIASLITLSATQEIAADADGNGTVNIKDATAIQKFSAGMDTGFNIGETLGVYG